jgi:hypothetical protein
MDKACVLHIDGELDEVVKMEIEKYCKARGDWWDSLLETVGRVQDKNEEYAAKKEAAEKKREEHKAKEKAERKAQEEKTKAAKQSGRGKKSSGKGKGKGKKPAEPFVRKDEDFPPLA